MPTSAGIMRPPQGRSGRGLRESGWGKAKGRAKGRLGVARPSTVQKAAQRRAPALITPRNYHAPPLVLSCLVWGVWRTSRTKHLSWAAPRQDLRAWYFASAFVSPQPEPHASFL